MSKLYNKYLALKQADSSKMYLFKSGIFYLFIADDAIYVSDKLGLKLTNLNESVQKCGFPTSNLSKYIQLFEDVNIPYQIVDENLNSVNLQKEYIESIEIISVVETIKKLNIDKLSPIQAFTLLLDFQKKLNDTAI